MKRKQPDFWQSRNIFSLLLLPLSGLYYIIFRLRFLLIKPYKSTTKIICIGNANIGGAGKTPFAIALGEYLLSKNYKIAYVSKLYKARLSKPVLVDKNKHSASDVGDEPLLLSKIAPVYAAKNRLDAIIMAENNGYDYILMDDGLQNPSFHKDLSILIVNYQTGFGNGFVLPSGSLREPLNNAIKRSQIIVSIGNGAHDFEGKEVIQASVRANSIAKNKKYIAFAGIAYPAKFFNLLQQCGYNTIENLSFPDHYNYTNKDIEDLFSKSKQHNAQLITTEKDYVRIKSDVLSKIEYLPIRMVCNLSQVDKYL